MQSGLSLPYDFPAPPEVRGRRCSPPPPSREARGDDSPNAEAPKQDVKQTLARVSDILEHISAVEYASCTPKVPLQTGRRRAASSLDDPGKKAEQAATHSQRALSLDINSITRPVDGYRQQHRPMHCTDRTQAPQRTCGIRRPSSRMDGHVNRHLDEDGPQYRHLSTPEKLNMLPHLPLSPPPSPMQVGPSPSPDGLGSFPDTTISCLSKETAIENGWKWNETARCSSPCGFFTGQWQSPAQGGRPRKSSLRTMFRDVTRSPISPRSPLQGLGPIEKPFPSGEVSPTSEMLRSEMEWDSSDDESQSGSKWRLSWGKNSFKKSRLAAAIMRRNSGE